MTLSPGKRGSSRMLGEGLIAQNNARFQAMMQHERTGNRAQICQLTNSFMSAVYRDAFLEQYHQVPRLCVVMTEIHKGLHEEAVLCETEKIGLVIKTLLHTLIFALQSLQMFVVET